METPHNSPEPSGQVNAQQIETALADLRCLSQTASTAVYKDFWSRSKHVLELFKTLKPLHPEDRQRLWEQYRDICDTIHVKQVLERQALKDASETRRDEILAEVRHARALLVDEPPASVLAQARMLLQSAMNKMKTGSEANPAAHDTDAPETRLLKEDRELCWREWQQARDLLGTYQRQRHETLLANARNLEANAAVADPTVTLKEIRDLQQQIVKLGLGREQRETCREVLNSAWKIAIARLQHLREERKARHQEWRTRMQANLERWSEQMQRRTQTLSHLKEQISKLHIMLDAARTDEHTERVRGWIAETEGKIARTEEILQGLNAKTASVESRLKRGQGGAPSPAQSAGPGDDPSEPPDESPSP